MYNSYFGFSVSPFTVTPDPNFFYSNPVYQEAYATLQYGIEAKKGFLVITGEVGTGKTTLLRKLMHNLAGTIETVLIFNTYLNFTELLRVILYDLNPTPKEPDKVKLLQELNEYLIMQLKQSRIVSVLVDEAQNLSDEALEGLRLLSNLETDQEKLIQIVLMGQPELQERLDQPSLRQLKQRVALQCRLVPLKNDEVGPYIDFRLRAAGYKGKELFDPGAVRQITSYSKGIPRLVNIICDNGLLCAYASSQKTVSAQMIDEVARDLRLGSNGQASQAETTPGALVYKTSATRLAHPAAKNVYAHNVRQILKIGAKTAFGILVLVAVASLIDPQNFLTTAGKGLEFAAHNLNQWVLLLAHQEAVAPRANANVKYQSKEQRVTIPRGSSVYKIANDTYGANTILGMDLIQEFNPEIKSLNRVSAGRLLLLPSLTPETLLRKQSDGSYRMIVASFHNLTGAREYAGRLRKDGYQVTITPREVSEDLLLYRIEIDGLKDFEEASQTWLTGLKNEWSRLAGTADGTR